MTDFVRLMISLMNIVGWYRLEREAGHTGEALAYRLANEVERWLDDVKKSADGMTYLIKKGKGR